MALLDAYSQPGGAILTANIVGQPFYPAVVQLDRCPIIPHPIAFLMFAYPPDAEALDIYAPGHVPPPTDAAYVEAFVETIAAQSPPLLLLYSGPCTGCGFHFDVARYLEARPAVTAALQDYVLMPETKAFHIYVRRS